MKLVSHLAKIALLLISTSCAMMFNEKEDQISINSNPPGANIIVDGKNYGRTPSTIKLPANKDYVITLTKEGYGSAQFNVEYWVTAKNKNCIADILGTMLVIPYYSYYWSGYCNEFKEKEHFINIPRLAGASGNEYQNQNNSLLGAGNSPQNMIDYYYNQDMGKSSSNGNNYY